MKFFLKIFFALVGITGVAVFLLVRVSPVLPAKTYGATFSVLFARQMGLDWKAAYAAMLDDLGIRNIRIPVYWDGAEPIDGRFDFSETDWMIREAEARNAQVILAVGERLPRWPECHVPDWARELPQDRYETRLLQYIDTTIRRYKNSPTVKTWQVENEPFLNFGECPASAGSQVGERLDREISAVRSADSRPIMVTDSGELSTWIAAHRKADIFGSTLYRIVWNPTLGNFTYPLPPAFFRLKRSLAELVDAKKPAVIIELQAEPWQHKMLYETTPEEQLKIMNPEELKGVLRYASESGFDTFYLWGVEWWYWLKTKQDMPEMWNEVKTTIRSLQTNT